MFILSVVISYSIFKSRKCDGWKNRLSRSTESNRRLFRFTLRASSFLNIQLKIRHTKLFRKTCAVHLLSQSKKKLMNHSMPLCVQSNVQINQSINQLFQNFMIIQKIYDISKKYEFCVVSAHQKLPYNTRCITTTIFLWRAPWPLRRNRMSNRNFGLPKVTKWKMSGLVISHRSVQNSHFSR